MQYRQSPRVQAWANCEDFVLVAAMNPCPPGYYGYYGDYGDMGSNTLIRCRTIAPHFVFVMNPPTHMRFLCALLCLNQHCGIEIDAEDCACRSD